METYQEFAQSKMASRKNRISKVESGEVIPFYIAALGVDRCYGGPEEGGWWYDVTTILQVYKVWDWKQACVRARELKEDYPTCPRGRYSVIGGTDTYVRTYRNLEDLPEEDFTKPRYE